LRPDLKSQSIDLVRGWLRGEGLVQTRLICDVRDVAAAHLAAVEYCEALRRNAQGCCPDVGNGRDSGPEGQQRRFILGTAKRVLAADLRAYLAEGLRKCGGDFSLLSACDDWLPEGGLMEMEVEVEQGMRLLAQNSAYARGRLAHTRTPQETIFDMVAGLHRQHFV
jgi:hypothetical protein